MKDVFPGFSAKDWIEYYDCLNAEEPVEKLRLKLTDEGKKAYAEDLAKLKKARETRPEISYDVKYSWFE